LDLITLHDAVGMERVVTLSMPFRRFRKSADKMTTVSRYNHIQPWGDDYFIAYNGFTGAVALLTPQNYQVYNRVVEKLKNGSEPDFSPEEKELFKQMEYGGFVHADHCDQQEELKFLHHYSRYGSTSLGLVIAPTMACNMACEYCFESNKKGRMSDETIDDVAEFVKKSADNIARFEVTWYGGEPLLAMDIIERMSGLFTDLGREHRFNYGADIITNGYLLSSPVVDKLAELKVRMVQVTLDGPSRLHNKKRRLKNGKPSFETIIENLKYASNKLSISIRINVDENFTIDHLDELLDELTRAGLRDKALIYFESLEPVNSVCANIAETCHTTRDFSKVEVDYYRLLVEKGFKIDKLPAPMMMYCLAQSLSGFALDHEGDLYRCLNTVGNKSKSMGNIRDKLEYTHPNFLKYFRFNPFEDEICRECNILPLCLGGCPMKRADRGLTRDELCDSWKYNLPEMLEVIALSKYRRLKPEIKEQI